VQLDRLVELRGAHRLEQADGLDRRVDLFAVERCARIAIALAVCHYRSTGTPVARLWLAPTGETLFPPCAPFSSVAWVVRPMKRETSRFPAPFHRSSRRI